MICGCTLNPQDLEELDEEMRNNLQAKVCRTKERVATAIEENIRALPWKASNDGWLEWLANIGSQIQSATKLAITKPPEWLIMVVVCAFEAVLQMNDIRIPPSTARVIENFVKHFSDRTVERLSQNH